MEPFLIVQAMFGYIYNDIDGWNGMKQNYNDIWTVYDEME